MDGNFRIDSLDGMAAAWEGSAEIRQAFRDHKSLLQWPTTVGVPSMIQGCKLIKSLTAVTKSEHFKRFSKLHCTPPLSLSYPSLSLSFLLILLRNAIAMNSEVLVRVAEVWVRVYDFWGCNQQIRTIPVKPTLHQAREICGGNPHPKGFHM